MLTTREWRTFVSVAVIFCAGIHMHCFGMGEKRGGEVFQKELKEIREDVRKDPHDAVSRTRLGVLYWEAGKRRSALKEFRRVQKERPDYAVPYYFIGEAYFLERKPEKAEANYLRFVENMDVEHLRNNDLIESYVSLLHKIGRRFWSMKNYDNSRDMSRKILELDPDNSLARYNLAVYYYNHERDRSKAFQELTEVIRLSPESRLAAKAEFFIDYMRRNPDPRIIGDFSFMDEV